MRERRSIDFPLLTELENPSCETRRRGNYFYISDYMMSLRILTKVIQRRAESQQHKAGN